MDPKDLHEQKSLKCIGFYRSFCRKESEWTSNGPQRSFRGHIAFLPRIMCLSVCRISKVSYTERSCDGRDVVNDNKNEHRKTQIKL